MARPNTFASRRGRWMRSFVTGIDLIISTARIFKFA
jgi:hypothetical protein